MTSDQQPTPGPAVTTEEIVDPVIPPAEHDGVRDLIIIGSGPAGYTAATYAARANLHPLVLEGSQFGGALMTTTEVENFPGFPEGIQGPQLMDDMRTQAEKFGAELVPSDVTEVDLTADPKIVKVGDTVHLAHAVIVATGSKYRYLGLDNEQRLLGRGVSACATCDGFFFRDQDIVVVGGGDSAMEEATFLTRFAKSVTVVHRRQELRASKIMVKRAQDNEKIRWALGKQVTNVLGENTLSAVELTDTTTGATETVPVSGLFVAIGHDPRSELFAGQLKLDDGGYIQVDHPSTRTNIDGVFACGDVVDHIYRQAITSAGTGAAAAIDAERWLADTFDER
ncbi:thioredoxin reductase (NADPH) [Blastococcus xanthinilyticus]|uniref:Thioredoxin reductase n=1 Tax=Blastococcus xanthinilyticus TaxID=1564164 RepID=A0A5S5CRR1_9ACTN|nr:thioredoxin reductase (NADPH) [Blastococcus xanthinilyticus]